MNRAQKAQFLQEEGIALHARNGDLNNELSLAVLTCGGFERYGVMECFLKPRYFTSASLYPLPDEAAELAKRNIHFKFKFAPGVVIYGPFPIPDEELKQGESGTRTILVPYRTSTSAELDDLIPLSTDMGPSVNELRKAGRALTKDKPAKLAVIKKIYSANGGFARRPIVSSVLYRVPEGVSEENLLTIPEKDLEYSTTCLCVRRHLRLISRAA